MLKIDLVTETYPPEINGVAMTLGRLVEGLRARGDRVVIHRPRQGDNASPRDGSEFLLRGMRLPLYRELRMGFPATRHFLKSWRDERPDVIYVATEGLLGWSAIHAANRSGIPVVSGFHTNFHAYSRHYRMGWMEPAIRAWLRRLHRRTHCTLAPTPELAGELRDEGFGAVEVVERGVDTRLFSPRRRKEALRRSWGLPDDGIACLYVGRIAAEKNIDAAVGAAEAGRRLHPGLRLVLVGDGPLVRRLERSHPSLIFCGMQRGEALAEHYASGDLLLFPSLTETFGNVVLEAMASGLPVIAFDRAAASRHVEQGGSGLRIPPETGERGLTEALLALLSNREKMQAMGERAARHAADLAWDGVVERFASILASVTKERAS